MENGRKYLVGGAIVAVAVAGLGWTMFPRSETVSAGTQVKTEKPAGMLAVLPDRARLLGIKASPALPASEAPIADLPATISPPANARVAVTATLPGVVMRTMVVEGDSVRAGQPLAVVSSRDILTLGADLARANARLGVAQTSAARLSQLDKEGVIAGARADEARAVAMEARADVREKSRILSLVGGHGSSGTYTLTAPIAGRVTSAAIHAGSVVDGTTAPYVIDAAGQYEAQAQLPERLAGQVKPGMTVALGDDLRGTVTAVGSTIDPATRSVTLKAKLPAGPGAMAGRATSLSIFGPAPTGAAMVPAAAVTTLPGGDMLFVRTRAGVIARPVKAGGKYGYHVLILSGVKPGEQVVVAGTSALKPLAMGE